MSVYLLPVCRAFDLRAFGATVHTHFCPGRCVHANIGIIRDSVAITVNHAIVALKVVLG